jgi:CubicO group peptidase (beta-lactamase class C family)
MMRKHNLPAFAITVVNDKGIYYQYVFGYADREKEIPATTKTVFKLWSVSKAFTAIEIFREVEEGLLDVDSSLVKYLPDFKIRRRFSENKPVTIKSILAHRSGLPRNECVMIPDSGRDTNYLERFENATNDCFMAFPVGYRYKYSNLGYDLLGRIIEENRGQGFFRYMKEHLLDDLGMESSTFHSSGIPDNAVIAKGYEYYKGKYYPMIQYDDSSVPSGNLYSTIEDLSVFIKAVVNNEVFDNKEIMFNMFVDHYSKKTDPETMGLGWKTTKINGSELMIWHDGGPGEGIGALVCVLPFRKLGIAMIGTGTSFSGSISVPFAIDIINHLLGAKSEKEKMYCICPVHLVQ